MDKIAEKLFNIFNKTIVNPYYDIIRIPKLKNAKRHVFVDCGANTCGVLRNYIQKFPDFEFFAFEAQPELAIEGKKAISENPNVKINSLIKLYG